MPWDHSTFSQNRTRRVTESGLLERLCAETVARAITQQVVSQHTTLDGTLVQANASHKSFVPREVVLKPAEYTRRIRSLDAGSEPDQAPGNPTVTCRGERRSNQTPVSTTDPDATLAHKGHGTAAMVGYTVNGLMENRHRLLRGIDCGVVSRAGLRDGWRAGVARSGSCDARSSDSARGCGQGVWGQAMPDGARAAANPAAQCGQHHRTGGGASAGATAEPDGGLPPLTAGTEEDRRTLGRGEMRARLPARSAARAPAGPRRSLSDGLAAQPEADLPTFRASGWIDHKNLRKDGIGARDLPAAC